LPKVKGYWLSPIIYQGQRGVVTDAKVSEQTMNAKFNVVGRHQVNPVEVMMKKRCEDEKAMIKVGNRNEQWEFSIYKSTCQLVLSWLASRASGCAVTSYSQLP
jgi:hypothetical protein